MINYKEYDLQIITNKKKKKREKNEWKQTFIQSQLKQFHPL